MPPALSRRCHPHHGAPNVPVVEVRSAQRSPLALVWRRLDQFPLRSSRCPDPLIYRLTAAYVPTLVELSGPDIVAGLVPSRVVRDSSTRGLGGRGSRSSPCQAAMVPGHGSPVAILKPPPLSRCLDREEPRYEPAHAGTPMAFDPGPLRTYFGCRTPSMESSSITGHGA